MPNKTNRSHGTLARRHIIHLSIAIALVGIGATAGCGSAASPESTVPPPPVSAAIQQANAIGSVTADPHAHPTQSKCTALLTRWVNGAGNPPSIDAVKAIRHYARLDCKRIAG